MRLALLAICLLVVGGCGGGGTGGTQPTPNPRTTHGLANILFIHHSVGDGLVMAGEMRQFISAYNSSANTSFKLWDHGYNVDGLRNAAGVSTGNCYDIPNDNTDPSGYDLLWTSQDPQYVACRDRIMQNHQVIAFKSCFTASAIDDAAMLQEYKGHYLAMRDFFDAHTDHLFIVISPPPAHRLDPDASAARAANARAFATWLASPTYLSGHPNVRCFNLFNELANPNDGRPTANMLRNDYEGDHSSSDSHPNAAADEVVGPTLANFLCRQVSAY